MQAASGLRDLPRSELDALYACAAEATAALAEMAEHGRNPVTEALAGADRVAEWAHFPEGDAVDPATHCRFYYHAHAAAERVPGEHGHFHVFVPVTPDGTAIAHLVGISLDARGRLLRLFTTNRWVTGEAWRPAGDLIPLAERFAMRAGAPSLALGRWIGGIVGLFRPQIAALLRQRDARIAQFAGEHPGSDVLEDRALYVTSEMPADFLGQIRAIEDALSGSGRAPPLFQASFSA